MPSSINPIAIALRYERWLYGTSTSLQRVFSQHFLCCIDALCYSVGVTSLELTSTVAALRKLSSSTRLKSVMTSANSADGVASMSLDMADYHHSFLPHKQLLLEPSFFPVPASMPLILPASLAVAFFAAPISLDCEGRVEESPDQLTITRQLH